MDRTGIIIEGIYDDTAFSIDGNGGENISWRNIAGYLCNGVIINGDYPVPAGIYNIIVTDVSSSYLVDVYCGNTKDKISQSVLYSDLEIFPGETNSHIILGIDIDIISSIAVDDKFQIIVGGMWLNSEQRIIKSTIFDPITAGTTPSKENTLRITNNSGKDLSNVFATITNSINIKQEQYLIDLDTEPTSRTIEFSSDPIVDLPEEQITRMTSDNEPLPFKVTIYNNNPNLLAQSMPYYPFSNIGATLDAYYRILGWVIAPREITYFDYESNNISFENINDAPYIRIDFGKGNEVCFNRLGIASDKIQNLTLMASNDDSLDPDNWETFFDWAVNATARNSHCYTEYGSSITLFYKNFVNYRRFRHWKIRIPWYTVYMGLYDDYLTKIARLEFLNIEEGTIYSQHRSRPFIYIDKDRDYQPISDSNNDFFTITVVNVGTTVDILVDGKGYDIRNDTSDILYPQGESVPKNETDTYVFTELSPLSGMKFKLSSSVNEGECALIWVTSGSSVFQVRELGGDIWTSGRDKLYLTGESDEIGNMSNGSTCDIQIRAFAPSTIIESDENPTAGTLCIYGQADGEYETGITAVSYSLITNSYLSGTIRIRLSDLLAIGDEIRFKFKAISTDTEITEVYFGKAEYYYPNFSKFPSKVPVTFNGNNSITVLQGEEEWTDWVAYSMSGDDEYMLSYSGTKIASAYLAVGSSDIINSYHSLHTNRAAYTIWDEGYTTSNNIYDIAEVQIRKKYRCLATMPLSCVVNRGIDNLNIKATLMPSDISDVLSEFGVSWETIS